MTWKPDPQLVAEAKETLAAHASALAQSAGALEDALVALEAAGTLGFLALAEQARGVVGVCDPERIGAALAAIDWDALPAAAAEVLRLAPRLLEVDEEELPALEEEIGAALECRDSVALRLEGARVLLGDSVALPDEAESAMVAFAALLKPELFRLLPLGAARAARAAWAAPPRRAELWWWFRGSDLPHTALADLAVAARVLQVFPEARAELEAMVDAEVRLADALAERAGQVVSLRTRLLRRAGRGSDVEAVALAAADLEERVVLLRSELTLSVTRSMLILDYEEAEPGETPPRIEAEGHGPIEGRGTERGRFEFPLEAAALAGARARLVVPIAGSPPLEIELAEALG